MFKEEREEYMFKWNMIGDIGEGRPNLGPVMDVTIYRLMQFTLRDVLIKEFDTDTADRIYYQAGELAGREFCKAMINKNNDFNGFIREAQELFSKLKINILRVEKADLENMSFTLTLAEDLDCSGLPVSGETVCDYDEGFIAGILNIYTGKKFDVKEIDCWTSGGTVCRFHAKILVQE